MTARHRAARGAGRRRVLPLAGGLGLAALIAVVVTAAGGGSVVGGHGSLAAGQARSHVGAVATPGDASASPLHVVGAGPAASGAPAVSPPVRLRIPAIGVDTGLQRLGLLHDGTLQPPSRWQTAGWYSGGPAPGQVGPAVIAGHVDSTTGPAVFYRLSRLAVGDRVVVGTSSGRSLTFAVDGVARFDKSAFPTEAVYGPVPDPELRLVTCTGAFDRSAHSYLDNLVVTAHLVTP